MCAKKEQDNLVIAKVIAGDYDAFEELVERYQGRIYRHLRKMVGDGQVAEDLLQETFLSAYKGLKGFAGASSFSTWLFRIATNAALMYLRKSRPDSVEYDDDIKPRTDLPFFPASAEFCNTPLDILLSDEGRRKIEEAIDGLPVLYRSVMVLRDVEGFSLEEVSKIMDSSVAAVKSRLHRARNSVRETLSAYYMEKDLASSRRIAKSK
ncbi:MAG: sigma-70 family RNA polymerase sigma factor [Desulfomonile tiedjei]|nr:sigma-70 family RNA polymerase sigma factor [Desulfomonile tiedjei]